jgi:hypothetical protein
MANPGRLSRALPALTGPNQKIAFAEMRAAGLRGILVYCPDYHCSHWTTLDADRWSDDVRLSDTEPLFTCKACGKKGADVRPNFHWEEETRRTVSSRTARVGSPTKPDGPSLAWPNHT